MLAVSCGDENGCTYRQKIKQRGAKTCREPCFLQVRFSQTYSWLLYAYVRLLPQRCTITGSLPGDRDVNLHRCRLISANAGSSRMFHRALR